MREETSQINCDEANRRYISSPLSCKHANDLAPRRQRDSLSTSDDSDRLMQDTLIVIPARMHATRLPGKPLADIGGIPMIVHVWQRATAANAGHVIVATDSNEIANAVIAAGGDAV